MTPDETETFDVVVAGSGAGGLAAAICAAEAGLSVLVVEKAPTFGGTTSRSGGWIWVPGNPHAKAEGIEDSIADARRYIQAETGNRFDAARVDTYLETGTEMLAFFENKTRVKFSLGAFVSDYHPEQPGGVEGGRSLNADPVDRRILGEHGKRLADPLRELTFMGMMIGSNRELRHFFEAARSVKSFGHVLVALARFGIERLRHGQTMRLTNGTALSAALAASAFDRNVEIRTQTALVDLLETDGRVTGVGVKGPDGARYEIKARRGVVLATGGFPGDAALRRAHYASDRTVSGEASPASQFNTGDALRAAANVKAAVSADMVHPAAWIPVSLVPRRDGSVGTFPHFVDTGRPGIISVMQNGKRFGNEAASYHDFGADIVAAYEGEGPARCWQIADHPTMRRYGLGFVKPFPVPLGPVLRSGYLKRGRSLADLARACGMDPKTLEDTVTRFNENALRGEDPDFGRGTSHYNRYRGDAEYDGVNPCLGPVTEGPFYAIELRVAELGTFVGLKTDERARVLTQEGAPIPGLYAAGNDAASIMSGGYTGGGITIGPAMTFGYIAARDMAGETPG